jgi:hypothetical protein
MHRLVGQRARAAGDGAEEGGLAAGTDGPRLAASINAILICERVAPLNQLFPYFSPWISVAFLVWRKMVKASMVAYLSPKHSDQIGNTVAMCK